MHSSSILHPAVLLPLLASAAGAQNHHLFTLEGELADDFGGAVLLAPAIDADELADAIVGLPSDPTAGAGAGAVIAYAGADRREEWSVTGDAAGDAFGTSLAVGDDYSGDGIAELLVGAPQPGCAGAGYVAILDGATGDEWDRIDGTVACDLFGTSVCTLPDLDGDGLDEIVVGAPGVGSGSGGVFVYSTADLAAPHLSMPLIPGAGGTGSAVCGLPDVSGDGLADVLVGAPNSGFAGPDSGAAVILSGADLSLVRGWLGDAGDRFGTAVAFLEDASGDGLPDVAIGAPQGDGVTDPSVTGTGAVRLFSAIDGSGVAELEGDTFGELYGHALAAVGDVDGDGLTDLAVGSPWHDFAAPKAGCVQIVSPAQDSQLVVEFGETAAAQYGRAVAGGLDVNADEKLDVAIGVPGAGLARVVSSQPIPFQTDIHTVSIAEGGLMTCDIDGGPELAGYAYYFLGSAAGQEPGFPIYNAHMPLVWDWYFCETAVYPNTGPFQNSLGSLNAEGKAQCGWSIGAGALSPIAIGLYLDHLVMVFNPGFDVEPIKLVTNVEPLTIVD